MMDLQANVYVLLGVICHWVGRTTSKLDDSCSSIAIYPAGPRICNLLCHQRYGCSGFHYSTFDLLCRLVMGNTKTCPSQRSLHGIHFLKAERNLTCENKARIFHTRKNILKCRHIQITDRQPRKHTRLLILPMALTSRQGKQLFLHNKSVASYPYVKITHTSAVAYIAVKRKLVVASADPCELFLASLDNEDKIIINKGQFISGISVDDKTQLVFLTSSDPKGLQFMATDGKGLRLIRILSWQPDGIVADSKRRALYVVRYLDGIVMMTYSGTELKTLVEGFIHFALSLDWQRDVLYYIESNKKPPLSKMILSNHSTHAVNTSFKQRITFQLFFSNNLYIVDTTATLSILDHNGKEIQTINTGYDKEVTRIVLCAIP